MTPEHCEVWDRDHVRMGTMEPWMTGDSDNTPHQGTRVLVCHPIRKIYSVLGGSPDLRQFKLNPGNQYPNKVPIFWVQPHDTKCEHPGWWTWDHQRVSLLWKSKYLILHCNYNVTVERLDKHLDACIFKTLVGLLNTSPLYPNSHM